MNLHHTVRGAITAINKDQSWLLYRSIGNGTKNARGIYEPEFFDGAPVRVQCQSISADSIIMTEAAQSGATVRRAYLYADGKCRRCMPFGGWRPLSRSGDFLKDADGNFWKVDAVLEDFSAEGWVSLQIVLQTTPKNLRIRKSAFDEFMESCENVRYE